MWKKIFVKLNWLRSDWALNFVFFAILLKFLEIWWFLECHIFAIKWDFQKLFSRLRSSLSILTKKKLLTCPGRRWNWVIFYCQSYDAIFAPKTVNIKKSKTDDCLKYKVLLSCKNSAQTVNNWKPCFNETTFWWLSGVQFPPLELLVGNSNRMQVLHQSYLASFLSRQKGNLPRN